VAWIGPPLKIKSEIVIFPEGPLRKVICQQLPFNINYKG
jgi:hypothetical protein